MSKTTANTSPSATVEGLPGKEDEEKRRGMVADTLVRLIKEKPLGLIGGIIVLVLFLTGIFANFLAPYGYNDMMLEDRLNPPSAAHLLGTDNMGRDMLSRIIYGARISMIVGLAGAAVSAIVGFLVGGVSGYFGGKFDMIFQRLVDAVQCAVAVQKELHARNVELLCVDAYPGIVQEIPCPFFLLFCHRKRRKR